MDGTVEFKRPRELESEIRGESRPFCSHSFHGDSRVQALILSPTRELATQTQKVILAMGDHLNIQAHACIGGTSLGEDIRKLEYGVHVVSGTPGRVYDMIKRRTLRTRAIKVLILVRSRHLCAFLNCINWFRREIVRLSLVQICSFTELLDWVLKA